jgi:hypothetical protein
MTASAMPASSFDFELAGFQALQFRDGNGLLKAAAV